MSRYLARDSQILDTARSGGPVACLRAEDAGLARLVPEALNASETAAQPASRPTRNTLTRTRRKARRHG